MPIGVPIAYRLTPKLLRLLYWHGIERRISNIETITLDTTRGGDMHDSFVQTKRDVHLSGTAIAARVPGSSR